MSFDLGRGAVFFSISEVEFIADRRIDFLRHALAASGGRIIVFQDGGTTYRVLAGQDQAVLRMLDDDPLAFRKRLSRMPSATIAHGADADLKNIAEHTRRRRNSHAIVVLQSDAVIGAIVWGAPSGPEVPPADRPRRFRIDEFDFDAHSILVRRARGWLPRLPWGIRAEAEPIGPRRTPGEPSEPSARETAAADGSVAPVADSVIRRTPHLDTPESLKTAHGESFTVTVRLDDVAMAEEEDGEDVAIAAPASVRRVTVQVELIVSPHFSVVGPSQRDLLIERDQTASDDATFTLEVAAQAPARPAGILALFKYHGRPCGYVSRAWDFSAAATEASPLPGHAFAATGVPIHVDTVRPDVTVMVTAPVADGQHFVCSVESPVIPGHEAPQAAEFGLPTTAQRFVAGKIEGLIDAAATPTQRKRNLKEVGYRFWKAAPPNFQDLLWTIFDTGAAVKNLYIATAEPTLPWELMIPHRTDGGVFQERRPLGVEFAIGRWTRGDAASPPQRLPVRNSFVIAPNYSRRRVLVKAADEVQFVEGRLRGTRVPNATVDGLDGYFTDNSASLLHFVCHGAAATGGDAAAGDTYDAAIYLDDEEELRSDTLLALDGFKALCRRRAPMVFLNACDAGLTVPALVGSAGFPAAFSDIGARAILAPLWPVNDALAHEFAMEVYQRALAPGAGPIAEIVRAVRERAYADDDSDTYAAYAFYGDPSATLQLVDR